MDPHRSVIRLFSQAYQKFARQGLVLPALPTAYRGGLSRPFNVSDHGVTQGNIYICKDCAAADKHLKRRDGRSIKLNSFRYEQYVSNSVTLSGQCFF